jgi:hypothetical protein
MSMKVAGFNRKRAVACYEAGIRVSDWNGCGGAGIEQARNRRASRGTTRKHALPDEVDMPISGISAAAVFVGSHGLGKF